MKKQLLLIGSVFLTSVLGAQTYFSDDFSSGNLNNWTLNDADNDGNNWYIADFDDGVQNEHATSASYANQAVLTPDNWMVSSVVDLTNATGAVYFSWSVYAQDQAWAAENYSVYVSTSSDVTTMTGEGAEFTEVLTSSTGYIPRSIDISSFIGQPVYVAFRHHNVSDQFRINLDDIRIATVSQNDLEVSSILVDSGIEGDRTFSVVVKNVGLDAVTAFDLDWSFDGGSSTTVNVSGINLAFGSSYTVEVNVDDIAVSTNVPFSATITTSDDDDTNNSLTTNFNFIVPIRQYISTDSHGNSFNLYDRLSSGQAIVLDFMASWCGPCESSTPEISEFIQDNGSGEGPVEAIAITVETTDNATVLNALNWNGGFYSYPKFAYIAENDSQWDHYATGHGLNSGGGIPFFLMICPNITDPSRSTIVKSDVGFGSGMFGAYQTALDACPSASLSIEVNQLVTELNVYPNPASDFATVTFNATDNNTVIEVINSLGQSIHKEILGKVHGQQEVTIPTSTLSEGLYFINIKTDSSVATARLSVVK